MANLSLTVQQQKICYNAQKLETRKIPLTSFDTSEGLNRFPLKLQ